MRSRNLSTLALGVVLSACGGSSNEETSGVETASSGSDGSSGAPSGTDTASPTTTDDGTTLLPMDETGVGSTSGSTSGTSDGSSSSAEGTTEPPSTTTGGPMETGESTSGTTSDETTGGQTTGGLDAEYAAFYIAGGLDRIAVRKANKVDDLCTTMIFVWPGPDQDPPGFTVALPGMWGVQSGLIHQGAADCLQFMMFPPMAVDAAAGDGSASWMPDNQCPATLDIDLTLEFQANMPWVPAMDVLQATGIPVQGC